MLICNNCNTVNEDGSKKCMHCQMAGNFRHQMGEYISDNSPVPENKVICRNCGSEAPGEATKCIHCRFPLAAVSKTTISNSSIGETGLQPSVIHSPAKRN